jgi:multidrug efflux pump subunit AcrB
VVAIALLISWFVAVIFAPVIGNMLLSPKKMEEKEEGGKVMAKFRRLLLFSMRHPKATLAITFGIFGLSLLLIPLVPSQFFPSSDRPELIVDMNLTQGSTIYATDRAARKLDAILKNDPDIDHWSSYVGQGAIRFYLPLDVQLQNDFFTETVIVTKSLKARERVRQRLEKAMKEQFPEVVSRIFPLELGPPVGWPVQYRVSGYDPVKVREYAYKVSQIMGRSPDLEKVNFNWMEPIRKLRIKVNQDQTRILGMSSTAVAQAIYAVVSGVTATQVRDDIYLVDVLVRAQDAERMSLETIRGLEIPLPNGKTVPLTELASVDYVQDLPLIWRRDRLPTLTVQADVRQGVMPATAVDLLKNKIEEIRKKLPPGYKIVAGGSVEESEKSQASVAAVFPLMFVLMMTILMIQMQNFKHLLLVMSVAPLGVIGVVLALLLTQQPMGFVALLGVVALIGMIVRNSVILVHQIEVEKEEGRHDWDAVVEATVLRFRPIMLTAAAAILGMIPIAPTVFWGPMASAIMGGLAVATLLTLIFLPSLYITWFRIKEEPLRQIKEAVS